ncbi:unnamed protein product [Vitrella brassicaformis CCMP3155]|uniref:Glycerol-3-phosphate dehydrogenase [NAD(+)] n=1 Tax=Vitrella brassicaformis (strain CCMP3155) TaxID=1169540 RepID=A0A0G4EYQ1_VITBC|nr:unnamed protein product [Vitrella brassicaformis CCMP3155]|mmetsp:Transcript_54094/g.136110  ORF Transcript_54094/g.136110 Transcript_54094/m.136110 type:complete len:423 (-) Transcript_54094:400-1668(-)|eukprot:CEM04071.1 unnamed protein product [Vitrella brassicaformis CCMP3155]
MSSAADSSRGNGPASGTTKEEAASLPPHPAALTTRCAAVLGGGSFGTALSQLLARQGTQVRLWMRDKAVIESINERHENPKYLAGQNLSEKIKATSSVAEAVSGVAVVLLAVPTAYFRGFLLEHMSVLPVGVPLICCSKGIENDTLLTPFEIMEYELPGKYHRYIVVLSGPSFAKEVINGKPTSVTIAARDPAIAKLAQYYVSDKLFRAYRSTDVIGVEICGAIKNVYAIAAGACDGCDFGFDGRAAMITRGLAEIARLAVIKGANPLTISGLAGVGDLVLTCTGNLSRNWQVGNRLAQGEKLEDVIKSMKMVAEGVNTAKSLMQMVKKYNIEMPIAEEVYKVLYEGKSIEEAMNSLSSRALGEEIDDTVKEVVGLPAGPSAPVVARQAGSGLRQSSLTLPGAGGIGVDDQHTPSKLVEHLP